MTCKFFQLLVMTVKVWGYAKCLNIWTDTIVFLKFLNFKLCIYFWLCWIFITTPGLLPGCGASASRCGSFSSCRAQALGCVSSVVVVPFVASFPRHALAEDGQGGREQVKILLRDPQLL